MVGSGEHRLPACAVRQPAERASCLVALDARPDPAIARRFPRALRAKGVSGKLPETTGWQPVLPETLRPASALPAESVGQTLGQAAEGGALVEWVEMHVEQAVAF